MERRTRRVLASVAIGGIFLVVQVGALALVEPFKQQGHQVVEDTGDPSISVVYLVAILVATGLMLAALRFGGASLLRLFIIFAGAYVSFFVFQVLVPSAATPTVDGQPLHVVPGLVALAVGVGLYVHPEWYVIDAAGIVMGIGAAGMFGVNFGVLPALVLLAALAVYDAISVYGTEHMLTLASGVMEMRVPVVLVVPLSLSYSFLDADPPDPLEDEENDDQAESVADTAPAAATDETELTAERLSELGPAGVAELDDDRLASIDTAVLEAVDDDLRRRIENERSDRDALFIGLGDAVIPTVLVASAAFFLDTGTVVSVPGLSVTLPALTAMVGTMVGLSVLLWMVLRGRAHAGLPLLNGGTIAGYLLGALASGLSLAEALGLSGFL